MTISPLTKQVKLDNSQIENLNISLEEFWDYYFTITIKASKHTLSPSAIRVLSYICCKDANISQFKGDPRAVLRNHLNISNQKVTNTGTELLEFGLLERPEESNRGEIYLTSRLKTLQRFVLSRVNGGHDIVSLLFKFKIEPDKQPEDYDD